MPAPAPAWTLRPTTSRSRVWTSLDIINWETGIQIGLNRPAATTKLFGNYLGVDVTGKTAAPNGNDIAIFSNSTGAIIGSPGTGLDNVISGLIGTTMNGINIAGASGTTIQDNNIGTSADGTKALGSGTGILVQDGTTKASNITIGGSGSDQGNLISGNDIGIENESQGPNFVLQGNLIGTAADGLTPLPNTGYGVFLTNVASSVIGGTQSGAGNIIDFNGTDGVYIDSTSQHVAVLGNSIYDNGNLGIDLQPGGNNNQAAPKFTSVTYTPILKQLSVSGTVTGPANSTVRVEFFANPPYLNVQGKTILGFQDVLIGGGGTANFTDKLSVRSNLGITAITATATDANNNTSAFSKPVLAPPTGSQLGVYYNGQWYLDTDSGQDPVTDIFTPDFGFPGAQPVVGNWGPNGSTAVGVYDNGQWWLDTDGNYNWDAATDKYIPNFGFPGAQPVVGNWGPNGSTAVGVYDNGQWYLDTDGDGIWNSATDKYIPNFGFPGAQPVVGNWGPNGSAAIGVYYNGQWYLDTDGDGSWNRSTDKYIPNFGFPGAQPFVGNWGPNGSTAVGVYSNNQWYLDTDGNGVWNASTDRYIRNFGFLGAQPVVGSWQSPTLPPTASDPSPGAGGLVTPQQLTGQLQAAASTTAGPVVPSQPTMAPPNITSSPSPTSTQSFFNAALALFFDGVQLMVDQVEGNTSFGEVFFGNSQGITGVDASIASNSPYAGPFAQLFVLAGEYREYESLVIGRAMAESL
jgi:hypothetical protein